MRRLPAFVFFALLMAALVPSVHAQALWTAERTVQIQGGLGFLYLSNDYTPGRPDMGGSAWFDADLSRLVGLEGEGHFGTLSSPSDFGENSFLVGPRVKLRRGRGLVYAKAMVGRGYLVEDLPGHYNTTSYGMYAGGGGLEWRVSRKLSVRAVDAEFQRWPGQKPNGLTPLAVSTGLMYIIH